MKEEFLEFILPVKCPMHTQLKILGDGYKKIRVKQNDGQSIFVFSLRSTVGKEGYIETCSPGIPLFLVCLEKDEKFMVFDHTNVIVG